MKPLSEVDGPGAANVRADDDAVMFCHFLDEDFNPVPRGLAQS